jgi:hypothetical protein
MPFKDKLRELIERHGGMDEENLARIVRLARQIKLEFSMAYLIKLLNGQRFRQGDIEAICTALGEHPANCSTTLNLRATVSDGWQRILLP